MFVPHGTFHVWNTVTVPGGVALIGGGRHVATIASLSSQWPVDRLAPVLVINGAGTVVSDLVVEANVLVGSDNVPGSSSLLAVRAGGALVRDVRTMRVYSKSTSGGTVASFPNVAAVEFSGLAGGRFYGLSLDHDEVEQHGDSPLTPAQVGTLITVNQTQEPVHLYQASTEHLGGSQYQVTIFAVTRMRD